jgi:hypothetical protein
MVLKHFSYKRKLILLYYIVLHGPYIAVTNVTFLPCFPSHCTYMVHGPHTFLVLKENAFFFTELSMVRKTQWPIKHDFFLHPYFCTCSMVLKHFSIERKLISLYYTVLHGPHVNVINDKCMPSSPSHCTWSSYVLVLKENGC